MEGDALQAERVEVTCCARTISSACEMAGCALQGRLWVWSRGEGVGRALGRRVRRQRGGFRLRPHRFKRAMTRGRQPGVGAPWGLATGRSLNRHP